MAMNTKRVGDGGRDGGGTGRWGGMARRRATRDENDKVQALSAQLVKIRRQEIRGSAAG